MITIDYMGEGGQFDWLMKASKTVRKGNTQKFILIQSVFRNMQIWFLFWIIVSYNSTRYLEMPVELQGWLA